MKNSKILVTEGIESMWYYHLSKSDKPCQSLCGKSVMRTSVPFENWGIVGHLKERYCKECYDIYNKRFRYD